MTADQATALMVLRHAREYIEERWSRAYIQLRKGEYCAMYDAMLLLDHLYWTIQKEVK